MTTLLYRAEPTLTAFLATVVATDGSRVALDRTAFYPEGGGQPSDQGALDWQGEAVPVLHAARDADGLVWHELGPHVPPPLGASVAGEVDWRLRYRHMQRHSGEHLLAQAFLRVDARFRVQAVSMRDPECTIDLEGQPGEDDARAAEQILREIAMRDLPVKILEVDAADLHVYPLRRPPKVQGPVRLVTVPLPSGEYWEVSACGGTHVTSTAHAAPVVVLRMERIRSALMRVTFMAGQEATEHLSGVYRQSRELAMSFSTGVEGLPRRVEALRDELARAQSDLAATRRELAAALVHAAGVQEFSVTNGDRAEFRHVRVPDSAVIPAALASLQLLPSCAGLVTSFDGRCGVSSTLPDVHAGQLLRAWLADSGGRGGGKADVAQGQAEDLQALERAARAWLNAAT